MNYKIIRLFIMVLLVSFVFLVGSSNADYENSTIDATDEFITMVQTSIVKMLQLPTHEISIHAMLNTGVAKRIASTTLEKKGTPSEPEDVEAILLNKVIYIHEGDIYDITTPLHDENGLPFAVTGIKVKIIPGKVSKDDAKLIAREISRKIEKEIRDYLIQTSLKVDL